jgi:hypothetical protein
MPRKKTRSSRKNLLNEHVEARIGGGKSGFDPIASQREAGYAGGLFLRRLFTGRLRTRSRFIQLSLLAFGVLFMLPLVGWVGSNNPGSLLMSQYTCAFLLIILSTIVGVLMIYCGVMSILQE